MAITYKNGDTGNDWLDNSLSAGPVQIQGRGGNDTIIGGVGNDRLYGEDGNDVLTGGLGSDTLRGGLGADTYVISRADLGKGDDTLLDFDGVGDGAIAGGDVLRFEGFSSTASLTFVRHNGTDHVYLIKDGAFSSLITIGYAGTAKLVAGDYLFTGVIAPPPNRAPVAGADTAVVPASGPRTITLAASALLANDSDPDGDVLRIIGLGTAAHGTLSLYTNGTPANFADDVILYTPDAGYAGLDAFSYALSDGTASASATVMVTVEAQAPTAVPVYRSGTNSDDVIDASSATGAQYIQGRAGNDAIASGSGDDKLYGNDGNDSLVGGGGADSFSGGAGADTYVIAKSDLSGRTESIMDFDGAGDGAVSGGDVLRLTGFGMGATLTFVRQAGADHVYQIKDGTFTAQLNIAYGGTAKLTAGDYVFVPPALPANHIPSAAATWVATRTNSIVSGSLAASDADGDAIRFSPGAGPSHGTLKLSEDGSYVYAPAVGYSGSDAFGVRLDDGNGGLSEITVTVTIAVSDKDPSPWRDTQAGNGLVFVQRDGTTGSFYVAADTARVTKGGGAVADWTDSGVILGIPQGDGYVLETTAGGVTTTRPLAIGEVIAAAGQSNMEGWFTYAGNAMPAETGIYIWVPPTSDGPGKWTAATGAGAMAFARTLRLAEPDIPVAFVTGAVGGTKLLPATNVEYWLDTGAGSLYQDTVDLLMAASHGHAAMILWNQGEADAASRVDPLLYAAGLKTLFARFGSDVAPERIVISGLAFTRGNADALRAAQASVASADGHILYVPTSPAIETWDETHLTVPARILQGTETALAVLAAEGTAPPGISRQSGGAANDTLTGGALTDILQTGGGNDDVNGADGNDILRGEAGYDRISGGAGEDALSGGLDADTVDGGAGNDDVFGDSGDDQLWGGTGNDLLDGGTGADVMAGQTGDDTYIVDNAGDIVSEATNAGTDTVIARLTYALAAFVENLIIDGKEAINGIGNALNNLLTGNDNANQLSGLSGDDSLQGGSGNDTLDGGDGNDSLTGGSGADSLIGGAGNDTYYIDAASDMVIETSMGGIDTIVSSVAYTLPQHVEAIVLGGRSPIGATGGNGADSLTGNINGNLLDGAGGNDTLMGLSGTDVLRGGSGNDSLYGGDGADTLVGGLGADVLFGDASKHSGDIFLFESLADSGIGAGNRDIVSDFDSLDIFDLRIIDANAGLNGDQAFQFMGEAAFTAAGQVRYSVVAGGLLIELNVDADLAADAQILLAEPLAVLGASDFYL